jgi:DMSO/TMAO reductase YedYZ molybdopterin-dependent catalytic subunit
MGEEITKSPDTQRTERIPPGQREVKSWPVLHEGKVPRIEPSEWKLRIFGLVEEKRMLSYEDLLSLPRVKVRSDIHCVTGWSLLDNLWEGVSTSMLKELARIKPEAVSVMVYCHGEYTTNIPLEDFFAEDALFALKHNGEWLPPERGHPIRLVVPHLYLWKSAKWVKGIEFMAEDRPGYWELRGYHIHGNPWKEERYS